MAFFVWAAASLFGVAWGYNSPGLSLNIYVEPGAGGALEYDLGKEPVKVFLVLKNESSRTIVTERDFSVEELQHSLIVTDPNNVRHILRPSDETHKMPMPYFINEKAWSPAEKLPVGWVKSTAINDLREKVPVMFSTAGWYTLEAQEPFIRFASNAEFVSLGTMAVQDNKNNWNGALIAKKLQIYIKPPASAQVDVYVLDNSTDPPTKPFHVPVRLFKTSNIPQGNDPQDSWSQIEYIMEKFTDNDGKASLAPESGCLAQDDYTVIAKYADAYEQTAVTSSESGWIPESCDSIIQKTLAFAGEEPQQIPGDLDGDRDIDNDDFNIFLSTFGKCEGQAGYIAACDYDGDKCVTFVDYQIWYGYFVGQ
jgi:hypothetical protein